MAESDPTLLRLNLAHAEQQTWSEELLQTAHDEHRVLVLLSEWQLEALGKHLRRFTQAGLNDGRTTGLLSYYNPYVFQGLAQNLDAQQCYQFHAALLSWHWIDRDGDRSGFLAFPNPATWP